MHCKIISLFISSFAFLSCCAAQGPAAPNVLLLVVDDLNTQLGCYGSKIVKSPNIDRLAARGVRFDRAYCQYALCNPSRVSMLTGKRPETTGVYGLKTKERQAFPEAVLLPQLFKQNGYFCAGAGKIHHGQGHADPKSWDYYEDGAGEDEGEKAAIKARYAKDADGRPASFPLESDGSKTRDGLNVRKIAAYLEASSQSGRPFFLAAGLHKPHLPWTAPRRFFELYPDGNIPEPISPRMENIPAIALQTELSGFHPPESRTAAIAGYYACISFTDENIGILLEVLDRNKMWENTVVVLVSDNGFHLGDHGGLWSKHTLFEQGTRVPMIFAGAGLPQGKVVRQPVELLDIYPTLVELGRLPKPVELEGKSLLPVMTSGVESTQANALSLIYHYDVTTGKDILGRSVRTQSGRYTEWSNEARDREVYLTEKDQAEVENLAGRSEVAALQRQGEAYLKSAPVPAPGAPERPRALSKKQK